MLVVALLGLAFIMGCIASGVKGASPVMAFLLSVLGTPILGLIYIALASAMKEDK